MKSETITAETLLNQSLLNCVKHVPNFTNIPIEQTGLLKDFPEALKFTHFNDIYDSLIYSNLIYKALELSPEVTQVIDFGAGSSIPSLLALKRFHRKDVFLTAIDIDLAAEQIGSENAALLGLGERYYFENCTIQDMIRKMDKTSSEILIVSNPPYIASPEGLRNDNYFIPVDGGPEGDDYLLELLGQDYAKGTTLALLWGSLTSPHEVCPQIEKKFSIVHVEAYRIHFGHYTKLPPLKNHLYQMREKGRVFFETDEDGNEVQLVFGTILRAK